MKPRSEDERKYLEYLLRKYSNSKEFIDKELKVCSKKINKNS